MNYKILLPACLLFLSATFARAQKTISLNGIWQFQIDTANVGENSQWYAEKDVSFKDQLTVPGNWNTENRYAAFTGKAWYRKTVFIPETLKGKSIRLYFEGVYNLAKVWVNGKFVTENNLGYLQFDKNVSNLLHYGQNNIIAVSVDNHFKLGATWNWGGIRRPVRLLVNDPLYVAQNHVTPEVMLSARTAKITFELTLSNTSKQDFPVSGVAEIAYQGRKLKSVAFTTKVNAEQTKKLRLNTDIRPEEFKLWNLEDPQLYNYKVTVRKSGTVVDEVTGRFGLRVIELDKAKKQLRLNGKVIRPLGFNLVPDDRTTGNTLPLWRVKEDIDMMKALGAGVARLSHVPFHKELLDYLDEKGMLIFEEIPVWGDNNSMVKVNNPLTNGWLRRMIADHYNHTCIAGWSVGNEIGKNKEVMAYTDSAINLVKLLDTTRLGVTVSYTGENATDPLQLSDIGFMNSYGRAIHRRADLIHKMHPESTLFLSEFGLGQLNEDLGTDFPIEMMMDSLCGKPFLIGASLWTFNDYRSTYKDTKEPTQNRPWGLVDVARQKKDAYYSFRRANKPVAGFYLSELKKDPTGKMLNTKVNIMPRAVLDLPANELTTYRIVFKTEDQTGKLTGGDFIRLPVIRPGSKSFAVDMKAKMLANTFKLNVSLVSPQNYVMYDTTVFFHKPLKAKIIYAASGLKQLKKDAGKQELIQVRYEKDGTATSYKLRFKAGNEIRETVATTNNFINLADVAAGQVTNLELIASNNAGETVTAIQTITQEKKLLPPLIRYTEAADDAFFIEMETAGDDRRFIVQTTKQSGDYTNAATTVADTKGALKVAGLVNGQPYYFRIKHLTTDGLESAWSEQGAVTPDGGILPNAPIVQGLLINGNETIVCFQPVKKATGYNLQYKNAGERNWHQINITSGVLNQYLFKLPSTAKYVQVRMATISETGTSKYKAL